MARRGQAAMEFLMTYGWAILVVLAAIGALAYFGVLSPDRFLPSKCVINPPFGCTEFKIDATNDNIIVGVQNNAGVTLDHIHIALVTSDCDLVTGGMDKSENATGNVYSNSTAQLNGRLVGGTALVWNCNGDELTEGDRFQGDFTIIYTKSGDSVSHTTTGSIQGKAEV